MGEEETSNDLTDVQGLQEQEERLEDAFEDVENAALHQNVEHSNSGVDDLVTGTMEDNIENVEEVQEAVCLVEDNDTDTNAEPTVSTDTSDLTQLSAAASYEKKAQAELLESDISSNDATAVDATALATQGSSEEKSVNAKAVVTPAKGTATPTNEPSASVKTSTSEGGDESFVVQVDDTMLNDIDADLLDGGHGEVKAVESTAVATGDTSTTAEGETEEGKTPAAPTTEQGTKASTSTAETKEGSKDPASKDEKDTKSTAKRFVSCH